MTYYKFHHVKRPNLCTESTFFRIKKRAIRNALNYVTLCIV